MDFPEIIARFAVQKIGFMKRFFIILLVVMAAVTLPAQQAKRVYITLDVSGSMSGDKYSLANYTAQMVYTLCNDDDEVSLIMVGRENKLTGSKDPLKKLQHPMTSSPLIPAGSNRNFEINDIIEFNRIYKPSKTMQDWLFVIGDGIWDYEEHYAKAVEDFRKIVEGGTLNVCYLQTGNSLSEHNGFTTDAESLGVVDIEKSDTNPRTIKDGCDHFARKILGFSDVPLKVKKSDDKSIKVKVELPVNSFYLVYQDEVFPSDLPNITQVTADGKTLGFKLKGTPTTVPTKDASARVNLSGNVWIVESKSVIPANTDIEVCFDKKVSASNVNVYPLVEEIEFCSIGVSPIGKKLKEIDVKTLCIDESEDKAVVRVEPSAVSKEKLPESLLKETVVVVRANGKEYKAKYKDGGFECQIDLIGKETQYYAECDCPGHFKRVTPIMTIEKGNCGPEVPPEMKEVEGPKIDFGSITFEEFKGDPLKVVLRDSLTGEALNSEKFDVTIEIGNGFLYEKPSVHVEDDTVVVINLHPKGEWCECLFPEKLDFNMVSTPKEEAFEEYGKSYRKTVFPMHVEVHKNRPWIERCLWVIVSIIGLLLLFFYVRALQKKNRFKKYASMKPVYFDYYGNKRDDLAGTDLRKRGFGAWFARWFLPWDERIALPFASPKIDITVVATDSFEVVGVPKEGDVTNPEIIKINGYKPDKDDKPKEPVKLGDGDKITVFKLNGDVDGYLLFKSGDKNDGHGYRIFLSLLKLASLAGIIVLTYLMIRSFF